MTTIIEPEIDPDAPQAPRVAPPPAPSWMGMLAGAVAGAVAITVGMLVAALIDVASPLDDVGSSFIDRTPPWLKDLAIDWFGTNDKRALRVGMVIVIAIAAVAVGRLAMRRRWIGAVGIGVFGLVGVWSALERPDQPARAVVPPLLAAAVGVVALLWLLGSLHGHWLESLVPGRSRQQEPWDRRRFLAASGGAVAAAAVAGVAARTIENRRIADLENAAPDTLPPVAPNASLDLPAADEQGLVPGTPFITPNDDFYRIDTALSFPRIDLDSWTVQVRGMVDREITLTYDELLARPMVERMVTLTCVSNEVGGNLVGNAVWQGVLLADLLEEAGVQPGAEQLFSRSVDGFTCGFPIEATRDRDCLIAIGMNGEALPLRNGFPARLVVPGLYGYVSATKWLQEIELTTWDQEGYWVPRGWSREGPIKTHSRIDVPRRGEDVDAGVVAVAGVAWAQHRGVAKVEVRVDDGEWQEARLGVDASADAWRQWVYEWHAEPGDHRLQVRATDATGETQTDEVAAPVPNGASGYHSRRVTVRG